MSEVITRNPRADEILSLRKIWSSVFGDIGIDAFFQQLYDPGLCIIADVDGSPAAMGYLIPSGEIVSGVNNKSSTGPVKCAMIYAVATLPKHRGLGLGTFVVRRLISLAHESGYAAVVLCPSDDGLFEYYNEHTGMRDWFYINEQVIEHKYSGIATVDPVKLSAVDYLQIRESLLKGIVHIKHNLQAFEYQAMICSELGGGLFRIGDSCAIVERQPDGAVWLKELLTTREKTSDSSIGKIVITELASIARMFPAEEYTVRYPSLSGEGRRFGMIELDNTTLFDNEKLVFSPWYGVAFD
jgi:GNAT superfamily N-acetyltransferase